MTEYIRTGRQVLASVGPTRWHLQFDLPSSVTSYGTAQRLSQRFLYFIWFLRSEIVQGEHENTWLQVWPHPTNCPDPAVVPTYHRTGRSIRGTTWTALEDRMTLPANPSPVMTNALAAPD